jgi:hypothetical protein
MDLWSEWMADGDVDTDLGKVYSCLTAAVSPPRISRQHEPGR